MRAVFVILLIGVLAVDGSSLGYQHVSVKFSSKKAENGDNICKEEVLRNITKVFQMYMDDKVDPCDDFYEYACGNFDRIHKIPPERTSFSVSSIVHKRFDQIVDDFLSEPQTNDIHESSNKVKQFFDMCMDLDTRSKYGIQPAFDLIASLGGWHVLNQTWDVSTFDWVETLGKMSQISLGAIVNIDVDTDFKNPDKNVLQIYEDYPIPLPREEVLKNLTKVNILHRACIEFLILTEVPEPLANETCQDIMEFGTTLTKITVDSDNVTDFKKNIERMTLGELQKKVPQIDWMKLFRIAFRRRLSPKQIVNLYSTPYIYKLPEILEHTSPKTLANTLFFRVLMTTSEFLDDRYREAGEKFVKELYGTKGGYDLKKRCRRVARSIISEPLESYFIKQHFNNESKPEVTNMAEEFRKTFRKTIREKPWLDATTRNEVMKKLDKMVISVGYSDKILNAKKVNKENRGLRLVPGKYFESTLNAVKFGTIETFRELGKKPKSDDWPASSMIVNAFYSRMRNQMVIPAGHLQSPFYHRLFPKAINYGSLGTVVGHEMTHAFDKDGREYDSEGVLRNAWTEKPEKDFETLAECFVEQFNAYGMYNITLRGRSTQSENMADTSGLRLAYNSYLDWTSAHPEDAETLPELKMSDKQLFFLSFAHSWCHAMRPKILRMALRSGVHSPSQFRVRGALSNMQEFADAFKCPVGSKMNPKDKCVVW